MKLSYAHTGIPTTRHLGGMRYAPPMKLWISDPALSPDVIEYHFFEDGSPAPEMMKSTTHVALTTDDLDAGCLDSGLVLSREQIVDSVIVEDVLAIHLLDQVTGSLALAETGDVELAGILLKRLGDSVAKGGGVNGDFKLYAAVFQLFIFFQFP